MLKGLSAISSLIGRLYKFFIYICLAIMFFTMIKAGFNSVFGGDDGTPKSADGFTISAYNVSLDVKEDNKIDVTENITVDWYESIHHGIYKFTPLWLQYTSQDGKTLKRKANITKILDKISINDIKDAIARAKYMEKTTILNTN